MVACNKVTDQLAKAAILAVVYGAIDFGVKKPIDMSLSKQQGEAVESLAQR
jgi:hypothetical protein